MLQFKSYELMDNIFIPFHKQYVQLTKLILTTIKSTGYKEYLYQLKELPWQKEFDQPAEYNLETGELIKQSYLIENFDLLWKESDQNVDGIQSESK